MAAPALRSSSSAQAQSGSTFSVTKPANTASGDLLLAFQVTDISGMGSQPDPPTGWTLLDRKTYATNGRDLACFYKAAGGGEPASYTFNNSNIAMPVAHVWVLCLSGANTTPEQISKNSGTGTTATATGVTTAQDNEFIACSFAIGLNVGDTITPNALTDLGTLNDAAIKLDSAHTTQASAGATGNKTATLSGSVDWAALLVAVQSLSSGIPTGTLSLLGVGK